MSWQNNWGTVKAANAKACGLYHEVANVGKTIESSKKRVTWRVKVIEGKEFEISLTHSLASGKKVLRVDGIVRHTSKAMSFGDWDYVFNLPEGHVVHIIIKPSVDLNDMYDLIIDGVSFRRLPDRLDASQGKGPSERNLNAVTASTNSNASPARYANGVYRSDRSREPNCREGSFNPWECPTCTLVNEKPLAPVCEACGDPKPAYISPAAAARAKAAVEEKRNPAPVSRSSSSSTARAAPRNDDFFSNSPSADSSSTFNPFGAEAASGFANFPSQSTVTAGKSDDITSMLSGLDFNTASSSMATAPVPASVFQDFTRPPASPNPAEDSSYEQQSKSNGDLWASNMVNLNLKPESQAKPKSASVRQHQTLEQARQSSFSKDKVPVMPLPTPMMMAPAPVAPAGAYYATTATSYGGTGGMATPGAYGYGAAAPNAGAFMTAQPGMGMGMGMGMMGGGAAAPNKPPAFYGSDPFATLS